MPQTHMPRRAMEENTGRRRFLRPIVLRPGTPKIPDFSLSLFSKDLDLVQIEVWPLLLAL